QVDVKLDNGLAAAGRQAQITNVDETGASGAACAAGGTGVGACRRCDERQRTRRKISLCIESIQFVNDAEIAEPLIGRAEAQRVAQLVARRGSCGRVCTAGEIRDALFEDRSRDWRAHCYCEGVLMVRDAWRAVGQSVRVRAAVRIAAVGVEPLGGA